MNPAGTNAEIEETDPTLLFLLGRDPAIVPDISPLPEPREIQIGEVVNTVGVTSGEQLLPEYGG